MSGLERRAQKELGSLRASWLGRSSVQLALVVLLATDETAKRTQIVVCVVVEEVTKHAY